MARSTMHPRFTSAALLLLLVAAGGCTPEPPEETHFGPQDLGGGDQDAGTQLDLGEGQAVVLPTVDGVWFHLEELALCIDFLTINEQLSWFYYITETEQTDSGMVHETWHACQMDVTPIFGLQTVVPRRLLDSVFPVETRNGMVSGTDVGSTYVSGLLMLLWGVDFEDPLYDPFPEDGDDPRIVDTDGDGHPGATVYIGPSCEAYQIERKRTVYQGSFVAPDRIEGQVVDRIQTRSIDSSQPLCGVDYATWPNESRSSFTRVRVDGQGGSVNLDADHDGRITCEEAMPYKDVLFQRLEADHRECELPDGSQ
ncbi:MAG: hypothetical protein JW797_14340 [Bradymonadales bacterium]|nr:hypothetical protein [Bradymonadales bacterium]